MQKKLLGIDIGLQYIKIAEINVSKNIYTFSKPLILHTPSFLVQGGHISDSSELVSLLKQAIQEQHYTTRKAIIILSDSMVITRDSEVPPIKKKDMQKVVQLQVEEYLPMDVSHYTVRYKLLASVAENPRNSNHFLTACVRTDLVEDFYSAFLNAGLKPQSIDITVNSMIKLYQAGLVDAYKHSEGESAVAFVDIGASSIKMVIFNKQIPLYQQVISYNNSRLDVLISSTLNISRENAEALKIQYGLNYLYNSSTDSTGQEVGPIITNHLNSLLSELYKYLQNYATKNPTIPLSYMYLTGGFSRLKGLDKYIASSLSIPCSVIEPHPSISINMEKQYSEKEVTAFNYDFPCFTTIGGAMQRGD